MKSRLYVLSVIMLFVSVLSVSGCGRIEIVKDTSRYQSADVSESSTSSESSTEESVDQEVSIDFDNVDMSATVDDLDNVVYEMGVGWNLGNSLEAWTEDKNYILNTETLYGNPVTTKEMIDKVKEAGFRTVRIPITFYNHLDENNTIDEAWLGRIEEVVNYVIEDDMYCVINIHHDTGDKGWITADSNKLDENKLVLNKLWIQIANKFSTYDNKLLFEGYNEILNSSKEWNYAGEDSYKAANELNQVFVDAVRSSGGNNSSRYLIVNTYAASVEPDVISHFELPEDLISNHLIVGVHCYTGKDNLKSVFVRLKKTFSDQDIPVIISEFGMGKKASLSDRIDYAAYYHSFADQYGISYFWWDDGNYDTSVTDTCEYALLNRNSLEWVYPDIVKTLLGNN